MNIEHYAQWLKTLSDWEINRMWERFCAPSEQLHVPESETTKAYLIDNEMTERGLL